MNKIVKKAMAAALALTIVGGVLPALTGSTDIFKSAIVAEAAETKDIAVGEIYVPGDKIHLTDDTYILTDDQGSLDANVCMYGVGDYTVPSALYLSNCNEFEFQHIFASNNSLYITPPEGWSIDENDIYGIKVISGKGTNRNPYKFELVYSIVSLTNVSVALEDSITLKFYATKESVDASGADGVTLTGPNDPINVTNFTVDKSGKYYVFSYPLYATQLDENVTIQFKNGEETVQMHCGDNDVDSYSYKINDYCDYVLGSDNYVEKTKNAVKSLKNLGIAADNYFDGTTNEVPFLDSSYDLSDFNPNAAYAVKFSLVLDSKLSARVYIPDLPDDAISDDGKYTAIRGKDGKNCFEIKNIKPSDLEKQYTLKYGKYTVKFTPLAFCYRAIINDSERNSEIAKAVYEYYKYTKSYTNQTVDIYNRPDSPYSSYSYDYKAGMTWREAFLHQTGSYYSYSSYAEIKQRHPDNTEIDINRAIVGEDLIVRIWRPAGNSSGCFYIIDNAKANEVIDPNKKYTYTYITFTDLNNW